MILNWESGKLVIGIADDGKLVGIEKDYCFLKEDKRNIDGWELEFRNQITSKFHEANAVNQHLNIKFATKQNFNVAIIEVFPRKKLSFVKKTPTSEFVLYCRQGNSTRQISIIECEEFFDRRNEALNR